MLETTIASYDFKVIKNAEDGLINLVALNQDAIDWIRIVILKPVEHVEDGVASIMLSPDVLEDVLRSLMWEGFQVIFK